MEKQALNSTSWVKFWQSLSQSRVVPLRCDVIFMCCTVIIIWSVMWDHKDRWRQTDLELFVMAESGLVVQPRLQPCFQAPPTLFKVPPTFCSTAIDCCSCTEGWERLPLYCRQWEVGGALDKATAGNGKWVGLWTRLATAGNGSGWGSGQG